MTWFKVDDSLAFHAKVVQAGNAAMGLWVRAGSWSAQQLTDGHVPTHIVSALGNKKQAERLVSVGLWVPLPDGYAFHQWNEDGRQPTRAAVEKERAQARDRMQKAREAKREAAASSAEVRANTGRSSGDVRSTRPGPARPDPSIEENNLQGGTHVSSGPADEPPLFPDHCTRHANTYEPGPCGNCADVRKARLRLASIGPHNPATKPHCGECDEARLLTTRFGTIPCPNCNPAAERAS